MLVFFAHPVHPHRRQAAHPARPAAPRSSRSFGATFLPTDTLLLMLLMAEHPRSAIFLLTALFGRVWCGWACPQTVYMEFLFRPIERCSKAAGAARASSTARRADSSIRGGC